MKNINLFKGLAVFLALISIAAPVRSEQQDQKNQDQAASSLKAVDPAQAMTPGSDAAKTIMKEDAAAPLNVKAVITGEIVSVDANKNLFTVKDDSGKRCTLSAINTDVLQTLKKGSRVRISIPAESQAAGNVFKA